MKVVCLCPTFGRPPGMIANTIALFLNQDYPADKRRLIILDDGDQYMEQGGDGWAIYRMENRFPSLPAKYAFMTDMAPEADAFIVWDDDDVYMPWHISAHVKAMQEHGWSHPSFVWSTYGSRNGVPRMEPASGRFHGSLAVRRDAFEAVGGWLGVMPVNHERRADFDQRMIGSLASHTQRGDPLQHSPLTRAADGRLFRSPGYVFRWGDSGASHCQGLMTSPDNESWWKRVWKSHSGNVGEIRPAFDKRTVEIIGILSGSLVKEEDGPYAEMV